VSVSRIDRARGALAGADVSSLLISQRENVRWISGFTGSSGFVFLTDAEAIFATDSRYTTQAQEECPGFEIVRLNSSLPEEVVSILKRAPSPRIGFEADVVTVSLHEAYAGALPDGFQLVPTKGLIAGLRQVKDATEIAAIERACDIADRAFAHVRGCIAPGVSEWDLMLELEWFMRKTCRAESAFDIIVASGWRSALPHGRASDRILESGDFVTLDYGARLEGYCSDITRTVALGEPTPKQVEVYNVVRQALEAAIASVRPGIEGKAVDAVARGIIADAGYGEYFGHGLGHGLGLAVHDGPAFSTQSAAVMQPGIVATVEPGIYLPGWGGVRIEQDIVVTEEGCRVLTHAPTELIAL
jgi:Xaa-Pro aminopeptidase